ncbi:MAG: hypothetical protein M1355_03105 [Patescibacteria group bacterium]|nr:hypothetical protein [Patescibacteria group bacterium]
MENQEKPKNRKIEIDTKWLKIGIAIVAVLVILFGIFSVGVIVGRFRRPFLPERPENTMMPAGRRNMMPEGRHGVAGIISKIEGNSIWVKNNDGQEKEVLVTDKTEIDHLGESLKISDPKADDHVIIMGSPNQDNKVEAKLIRVMR